MGQVYEAEHEQLGKRLAVKILHPLYSTEQEVVERFRREAQAASSIGHPNIVNVTDSGTTPDGRAYFVMELLDGMELADVITQEGPFDYERAVDIAIQVCQALGAAHRVGVIHRDMKPENIFLTTVGARTDVVKILDFGIAKNARLERVRGGQLTEPGLAVGTPEYMAPEQAAGKPPNPRFDIYAVGGILYATLTGRPPHRGSNVMEILTRKATRNPTPPRSYRPDIPVALEQAVMTALSRSPDRRPSTMEELEYELRKSLAGRPNAVAHMLGISHALTSTRSGDAYSSDSDPWAEVSRPPHEKDLSKGARGSKAKTLPEEEMSLRLGPVGVTEDALDDVTAPLELPDIPSSLGEEPTRVESRPWPEAPPPTLANPDLFSVATTPTELASQPAYADARELEEQATTSVYLDASELREPAPTDPLIRRHAAFWGAGLAVGLALTALVGWALWPPPAPEPVFLEQPPSSSARTGDTHRDIPSRSNRYPSLVGWEVTLPAEVVAPETLARRQASALRTWIAFTQRSIADQRFLTPEKDSAQHGLERIAEMDPDHPELPKLRQRTVQPLLGQATRLHRRGKLEEAEATLRGALAISPDSRRGKEALASLLVARGRSALLAKIVSEAETLAQEAASLDPSGVDPMIFQAELLEAQDKPDEALSAYQSILKTHRGNRTCVAAVRRLIKDARRSGGGTIKGPRR